MWLLQRLDRREGILRLIVSAGVIERRFTGPDLAHHIEELVGARVALIMLQVVAVLALLDVVTTADHMHRQATIEQMFKRRQLACGQGRRDEPWAMGQQEVNARSRLAG